MKGRKELDMSFSGLKTAVRQHVENLPEGLLKRADVADLAFALQAQIADVLAERCAKALERFKEVYAPESPALVVSGGVAANKAVRVRLDALCEETGVRAYAPPLFLCSDNAAMIAWAGVERLRKGLSDPLDFKARPRWPLDPDAAPRHGAGIKA
jgi:N6-L-threonylcarbamoyladenine synthase